MKPAALTFPGGNEKWLPAAEIRGEGIFIELDQARLAEWEARDAVKRRMDQLLRAFEMLQRRPWTDPPGGGLLIQAGA